MLAYVVLTADGKLHGVYTSPVDAHLQAKSLPNSTTQACRLNAEAKPWTPAAVRNFCEHDWTIESVYGTRSQRICTKCDQYLSDLPQSVATSGDARAATPATAR